MKRYIKFLFKIYSSRLGKDLSQPYIQVTMQTIGSLCFFYFHLLAFGFIVHKFSFSNWNMSQMYVLLFSFEIYTYLAFFIFWKGFMQTVNFIHGGQFDLILTKPASNWVLSFFQGGGFHNLLAAGLGIIYLVVHITYSGIVVSFISVLYYILTMIFSLLFLASFTSIFICLNFYFGRLNIFGIGFAFQELMKYPAQLYSVKNPILYLFILPFALLVTVPSSLLIGKHISLNLLILYFFSIIFTFIVSQIVWNRSIRHYSSAA